MNKKISTLIISILLLLLFVSVFFLFSSNSEKKYSYIVATSVSSNDTTSITENTTFLYIFENNKCVSTKINTKLDNDTNANEIKEVYNSIMEAEKSNNANIINYSEEKEKFHMNGQQKIFLNQKN